VTKLLEPPEGRQVFRLTFEPTPADIDENGHVNNVVYLRWTQDLATAHWRSLAPPDAQATWAWIALRHEIDYRRPLVYHPRGVDIDLWTDAIKGASFEIRYEVRDDATVFAKAASVLVPFDLTAQRPRRVSPEERAFLERYLPLPA